MWCRVIKRSKVNNNYILAEGEGKYFVINITFQVTKVNGFYVRIDGSERHSLNEKGEFIESYDITEGCLVNKDYHLSGEIDLFKKPQKGTLECIFKSEILKIKRDLVIKNVIQR